MAAEDDEISVLLNEPNESDEESVGFFDNISTLLLNEPNESAEESVGFFDNISTLLPESIKTDDEKKAELTPEDVAWVDSCFALGSELSDDKWIAMKDAFLEALSSYPTHYEDPSAAVESNDDNDIVQTKEGDEQGLQDHVMEYRPSPEMQNEVSTNIEVSVIGEEMESDETDLKVRDDHVPEYHLPEETQKGVSDVDVPVTHEGDTETRETIFKVWDLDTAAIEEEDELIQQLKKLLIGSRPPERNDPNLTLTEENVDELVISMSDLQLKTFDN